MLSSCPRLTHTTLSSFTSRGLGTRLLTPPLHTSSLGYFVLSNHDHSQQQVSTLVTDTFSSTTSKTSGAAMSAVCVQMYTHHLNLVEVVSVNLYNVVKISILRQLAIVAYHAKEKQLWPYSYTLANMFIPFLCCPYTENPPHLRTYTLPNTIFTNK